MLREKMKPQRLNFFQVANPAVGDNADAFEGAMQVAIYLSPETQARRIVQVSTTTTRGAATC